MRQLWYATRAAVAANPDLTEQAGKFLSEVGWREFSHHLLHHFPELAEEPFKPRFSAFPWVGGEARYRAWCRGQTGYPIVDAGMRELWQTGYMHNRVRMIAASFLTKHLLVHWRRGEAWFWDTLVDADLANNACGWQWVAGSGADASPYFRIFNPVLQGRKFAARGSYVRRWVPELSCLPDRYLHSPWEAPAEVLLEAGVRLGEHYPRPWWNTPRPASPPWRPTVRSGADPAVAAPRPTRYSGGGDTSASRVQPGFGSGWNSSVNGRRFPLVSTANSGM